MAFDAYLGCSGLSLSDRLLSNCFLGLHATQKVRIGIGWTCLAKFSSIRGDKGTRAFRPDQEANAVRSKTA